MRKAPIRKAWVTEEKERAAAVTAILMWIAPEWQYPGKPMVLTGAKGAVAGLETVTLASGYIGMGPAALIGLLEGLFYYFGIVVKEKFGYDDSLDMVGVHGV